MATILQLRRGTTVQHSSFTGAVGEVTVDTTKDTVVVHDGTTAGGFPLAKESDISGFITLSDISGGTGLDYNSSTGVFDIDSTVATKTYVDTAVAGKDNTDEITEGTTNLYFTNTRARGAVSVTDSGGDGSLSYNSGTGVITYTGPSATEVRAHFSAGTGITLTDGAISTTITQYTDALARSAVSVTDSGGDGSLSYNNTTGVITYTGPSAADVRAHFSAGTGITLTNGAIAVDSTIATKTYADNAATTAVAAVIDSAPAALDTLNELAAALGDDANYSATTTTALGNRLRVDVNTQNLTSTQQGNALTNLGLTASLTELNYVDGVTSAIQTQLDAKFATADFNSTFDTRLGTKSTTNLSEGTNLYFTTARARDAFSAGTGITITNGQVATTITQYTDALARAAVSVTDAGGEGSLSYNSSTGVITYTGPSASDILTAIKTVDGSGSGLDADLLDGNSSAYYRINVYDSAGTLLN